MGIRLLSALTVLCIGTAAFGQAAMEVSSPATQPSAPATQPAVPQVVPAAVQAMLDEVSKAYSKANSLKLSGKISLDLDAGGEQKHESADFTASFMAPNKFRHEIKDDALVVSTGQKVYAFLPAKNEYVAMDSPTDRAAMKHLSAPLVQLLQEQNPVLLMVISTDAGGQLIDGATNVAMGEAVKVGDVTYSAITFDKEDRSMRVLIDPVTHLVRQIRADEKKELTKRGLEEVKTANITFDYTTAQSGAAPADELYAWTPPRDATVAKEDSADSQGEMAALALMGKPAPDFKIGALDGAEVSLASLKGQVVVLDFWATWCGPCVQSMPHLDQINAELSEKGLKVFAVNLEEPKALVQKFIIDKKLTMPVLLDTDGAVGKKYMANAIPETVVIGKDGVVQKVFMGFGGDEEPLRTAIAAEMKK